MTPSQQLFGHSPDWLSHTLERAGQQTPPTATRLADGCTAELLDTGILRLQPGDNPPDSDLHLVVSAGIHGNETAPIEVLNALVSELLNGDWQLACPALLILGNPPAMVKGERFIDYNLNRLFAGAHAKRPYHDTPEAARAHQLESLCRDFFAEAGKRVHYDLHTAIRPSEREKFALYPFVPDRQVPTEQCAFLLEAEVDTLLHQHKTGTTFSSYTSVDLGAESFTIELGKVEAFGQNDLGRFAGIENALRRLLKGEPAPDPAQALSLTEFEVVHEIINSGEQFHFHVPDDVANFTSYPPGTVIWQDDRTEYRVGDVAEAIIFPNREVPIGQRVGLMVRPKVSG